VQIKVQYNFKPTGSVFLVCHAAPDEQFTNGNFSMISTNP
jgi:hypothetical protein